MQADGFGGSDEAAIRQLLALDQAVGVVLPEAVRAGAEILATAAAAMAPIRTGRLFSSADDEAVEADANSATHRVFFGAFHARFQEFGTRKMEDQRFLRPAADIYRGDIEEAMRAVIDTAVGDAIVQHRYLETRK